MSQRPVRPVENYTSAFLVVTGALLFMLLWTVGATLGWGWVVAIAIGIDQLFRWVGRRR